MADIIPAIMPTTVKDLENKVEKVLGAVNSVQVDVMDGKFVHGRTWPYAKQDLYFEEMITQDRGLPFWKEVDYEIDLMVAHPLTESKNWILVGGGRIIAHFEAFKGLDDPELSEYIALKNEFIEIGLAIGIDTPIDTLDSLLGSISCIQLMGIKHIGHQGEKLDERIYERVKYIRAKAPELPISIDGGVSLDNAGSLIEAGANRLVSGSVVFESENPLETIHMLAQSA